ncbi:MAG: exopolysaccharide Pel transporter PelG [Psychromonas sp.]|nr:exopolysaccharide Pel transporter PelG [Psychromonas sp.]
MAGIGFKLNKTLKDDRLSSIFKIYGYAGILSSGAWVTSIVAILLVGFISAFIHGSLSTLEGLVVYATTLAFSLIATSPFLLPFTRYISDLNFLGKDDHVLPVFFTVFLMFLVVSFTFGLVFFNHLYPHSNVTFVYSVIMLFCVLCAIWLAHILAISADHFLSVMFAYVIAYGFIVLFTYYFVPTLDELIIIFLLGNSFLLICLLMLIIKTFTSDRLVDASFFTSKNVYWILGVSAFFYTLGTWIDKIIFWYHPYTGQHAIGNVNFSIFYDVPIFLAYLSIIPGMSIFFYRLESDYGEKNDLFFNSIREGATLSNIERHRFEIIKITKDVIRETLLIQAIFSIVIYLNAPLIFKFLNISLLYLSLFDVLLVGAYLQLGFMSVLAVLYYIDRQSEAMWLSFSFFVLNGSLSLLSIYLGPSFFGYGFALSLLIVFSISIIILKNLLDRLSYEIFMLQ